MTDPFVVLGLACSFLVGYTLGYGGTVGTLRQVQKILVNKEEARGFAWKTWLRTNDQEGGFVEVDPKEAFSKADKIDDLLE